MPAHPLGIVPHSKMLEFPAHPYRELAVPENLNLSFT